MVSSSKRLTQGAIENLESWPQTTSTGLEMEATREAANRAVQKSQYLRGKLGELKAVAEGRSVLISETLKFQAKQGGEKIITRDRIQLDGVFLTSKVCLLYTSPSPRDQRGSRMPSSA